MRFIATLCLVLAAGCQKPNPAFDETTIPGPPLTDAAAADGSATDTQRPAETICPPDPALMVCFRFQSNLVSEGARTVSVTASNAGYVAGPDGLALSVAAESVVGDLNASTLAADRLTIEAWVKARALPIVGARMGIVDYDHNYSLFVHENGNVRCAVGVGLDLYASALVKKDTWASLACIVDETTISLYLDGRLMMQKTATPTAPYSGPPGLAIGKNFQVPGGTKHDRFDGLIDNLRIWNRVRSREELCAGAISCR